MAVGNLFRGGRPTRRKAGPGICNHRLYTRLRPDATYPQIDGAYGGLCYNLPVNPKQIENIKRRYSKHASSYDTCHRFSDRLRPSAIERLALKPGETVLDLGCGTGLSFEQLEQGVGPEGRIIGVELSPEMLAGSRKKLEQHEWTNITLIEGNAEEVDIPGPVDAILTFFTPDIMNSRRAVEHALEALRPGGRLVAAGIKRAEGLSGIPVNLFFFLHYRFWRFAGLKSSVKRLWVRRQPYAFLERLVDSLERQDYLKGCAYIAYAVKGADHENGLQCRHGPNT